MKKEEVIYSCDIDKCQNAVGFKEQKIQEYVKVNTEKSSLSINAVHKAEEWFERKDYCIACHLEDRPDPLYTFSAEHFLPTTLEDYKNRMK